MTATKVKYEPRYKAGDWIVVSNGFMLDGTPKKSIIKAYKTKGPGKYHNYIRHATEEEISVGQAELEVKQAELEARIQHRAYRNTQEYKDASSILCLDAETLISKLGSEMLREIAEKLR